MTNEAIWNKVEHELLRQQQEYPDMLTNLVMLTDLFRQLRFSVYSLWLIPRAHDGEFWLERADSYILFRLYPYHDEGSIEIEAKINGKYYSFLAHPIGMTSELKALLDLLIAQAIEG